MGIKVCVSGADGSMGSLVVQNIIKDPDLEICGGITFESSPNLGKDIGKMVGLDECGVELVDNKDINEYLKQINPNVYVDFTTAQAVEENIKHVLDNSIDFVIGTTGLDDDFLDFMEKEASKRKLSGVIAPNMAIGVNVFFKMATILTKYLDGFDVEIIEAHHNRKRDAPSGTALKIAKMIAEEMNKDIDEIGKFGRKKGPEKRVPGEIGVHAIRAGDIVGDHTVLFAGSGERIELKHMAHSRQCFASGTIKAIKYVNKNKKKGKVFDMFDVLNLR
ncbi:MAG: 4-hydroxy-tetrahydrodipicolinate reductase [Candidatus Lokiarchaeota archaeon]|nr:4-hydroxy-tetrahydrodipicolinate reductase [Candidatus Lokiarchaeota archaeon]